MEENGVKDLGKTKGKNGVKDLKPRFACFEPDSEIRH